MAAANNLSIQTLYDNVADLQMRIIKNSEDIAKISSNILLATPKQISNILIDINNLQHQVSAITDDLAKLENMINLNTGKFNQSIIKINLAKNLLKTFKTEMTNNEHKLFSLPMIRLILVGVILAAVLWFLGTLGSSIWSSYLEQEALKRHPQIRVTDSSGYHIPRKNTTKKL